MSALLVLNICMPGGAVKAIAEEGADAQPVAVQEGSSEEVQETEELFDQADAPDEDAPQAIVEEEESSQEPLATEDGQAAVPEDADAPVDEESWADAARAGPDEMEEPSDSTPEIMLLRASDASGFHATITSNQESYSAGSMAIFSVRYTIDQGAFQEGDTVTVSIPPEVASSVRFSVDPLHFSSVVDNGDGTWNLVFGPNATAALVGSFNMYISTANVDTQTTAPVTVGNDSKDLTVIPTGSAGGVGVYTDAIMKDAAADPKVSYGGYDYSEGHGDDAAQIGVYESTNDEVIGYRLYINNKQATMNNITVVDTLPDGMTFDRTRGIRVTNATGDDIDPSLYSVSISGQNLTFNYPGTLTDTVWVYYWVNARGGNNIKYTNRAEIYYQSDGVTYQEHRNYVLQGNNYNAACGEKSVDKTVVSSDPADQRVTYTIKFWNSNGFDVGEINLFDELDGNVRFLYADQADKFEISYDEVTHSVHIYNAQAITGSETEYVRFVVDFTDVPEGYTVENSVGGNTTKTLKMPAVQLDAAKTVDGATPGADQTFTFQLRDAQGTVLQEKQNVGEAVTFDKLTYSEDDLNADGSDTVMRYTVREVAGSDEAYTYDDTVYEVEVTLHKEADPAGGAMVTATTAITKAGSPVDSMTFDNTSNTASISVTVAKAWDDAGDRDGLRPESVMVQLLADGQASGDPVTLDAGNQWTHTWTDLDQKANGQDIAYTVQEVGVPEGYAAVVDGDAATGLTITNTHEPETVSVPVTKKWVGPEGPSVTVSLLADGVDTGETLELSAGNGWSGAFEGLPKYKDGAEIAYTVAELEVGGYISEVSGDAEVGFTITNTATETVSVPVTKKWVGPEAASVTVRLTADGTEVQTLELSAGNGWAATFTGLPKYNADGSEISYDVTEDEVAGYTSEVSGDAASGFTFTNTSTETVSVSVAKTWVGPEGSSVTVSLLADGEDTGESLELSSDNGWSGSFDGLAKYGDGGDEIAYTVTEAQVSGVDANAYETTVEGDAATGFTITNTAIETVSVSGSKTWDDGDNQDGVRPEAITVRLLADGIEAASATVGEDNGWAWSFDNLPKYDATDGHEIVYALTEDAVADYATTYDGYNITNSYTPGKTSVTVAKAWDDAGDQDGLRPASIAVQLYADGIAQGDPIALDAGNQWTHTWTDLDQKANGQDIAYTVDELDVPSGYAVEITGDATTGFAVTNTHAPETTSVSVAKAWDDAGDRDGMRPESVTVRLLANGADTGKTLVLSADNGWEGSFDDLDANEAGIPIAYTVQEVGMPEGYTASVSGDATVGYTVTNFHDPATISVSVEKAWIGPVGGPVTVRLLADGAATGMTLTLSSGNGWSGFFDGLAKYRDQGTEIVYTVEEDPVAGYSSEVSGDAASGFTITNTNTETIDIPVTKKWVGTPAESATIQLKADGKVVAEATLNSSSNWTHTFTGLPKYNADGSEIAYTVSETPIKGYSTAIAGDAKRGFTVTNTQEAVPSVPKSGDGNNPLIWSSLALASLPLVLVAAALRLRGWRKNM